MTVEPGKPSLPPSLLVLFDSLSNVDFVTLTKRSLREKVDQLKAAVAKEFAKKDNSNNVQEPTPSNINGSTPNDRPAEGKASPPRLQSRPIPKVTGGLQNNKPVDKKLRDGDKQAKTQFTTKASQGLKQPSSAVKVPPKFADLIKAAATGDMSVTNGTDKRDTQSPMRAQKPVDKETSRNVRLETNRQKGQSSRPTNSVIPYRNSPQPTSRGSNPQRRTSSDSRDLVMAANRRNDGISPKIDEKNEDRSRKQPTGRLKKKEEEERLLQLRKQKLEEERKRIDLRNAVLSGKKNAQQDLKTLVKFTQSQGSTVLSCGRPASHSPPSSRSREMNRMHNRPTSHEQSRPNTFDDYDEEEDDDDDFIDDGDNELIDDGDVGDVSKHIREIFGYDRRKYADFDDDDIQESSFSQIQKEEIRSAKLGRKEDLEDMRQELLHKRDKRRKLDPI